MATRHTAREWAIQVLFQLDFNPEPPEQALAGFWRERKADERSRRFMEELVLGVREHIGRLDEVIRRHAANWDLNRISAVDRNVLRLGLYEINYRPDVPPVVAINEAVDIAKRFGGDDSGKFVNGILDKSWHAAR
ncbi:MAG: transcription antitermination factor NusB [Lentisphaerae bacterium]|nr:transcription antitermination factor NusB [Lentisphaerota bacterium]